MLRRSFPGKGASKVREGAELHRDAVVLDAHCDTLYAIMEGQREDLGPSDIGHVDVPRLRAGGVDVQFFACWIPSEYKPDRGLKAALKLLDIAHLELERREDILLILSRADVDRARAEGKVGVLLSIEGGEAVEDDLAYLRTLYRLGVRSICLTWNQRNLLADGVAEAETGGGLTNLGREVVREMNRLGMIVDVSHLSEAGFWDVLEVSSHPVIASHSNARAVCPHPRNLSDDQIRALAQAGGVMGMNFSRLFVDPKRHTLERVLDHIDHVVELVGPEHVGLGSDFDGIDETPEGLEDVSRMGNITAGLLARGYDEESVRLILGGNFLRVMERVMG